jgi:hypothetical protein
MDEVHAVQKSGTLPDVRPAKKSKVTNVDIQFRKGQVAARCVIVGARCIASSRM